MLCPRGVLALGGDHLGVWGVTMEWGPPVGTHLRRGARRPEKLQEAQHLQAKEIHG